jgi:hypothetical protein
MTGFPATTIKVTNIEPRGDTKVAIIMEMTVDVHRLAEVSGELMRMSVKQMKSDTKKKK